MAGFASLPAGEQEAESTLPSGKMYHIACKIWFTASGSPMPLSFKFEGDDGTIQSVSQLTILYSEDKNFSGIPSKEYGCRACIGGILQEFRLIFYMEACKWVMVI
ncbi:MAG: hypothetical protein ACI4OO_10325 [Otoolea sp.]|nr:hypothetical protein [Clostridiaceae bacterium]MDD6073145.1 hypothetical protein [Clostridium sp.]MDY5483593.1 hypothetical protein [Clostridium sp.]